MRFERAASFRAVRIARVEFLEGFDGSDVFRQVHFIQPLILEWQKAEFFLARQEPLLGVGRSQRSGHANRSELVVS